ncbi:hypothetical protein EYV94_28170 [Puteibacter caeruleilacunae]|nr:hypothetical protein EYV94_28170 [Puteibacter caeruleilacunae]
MKSTYKKYTKDSQYKYDASGVKWQKQPMTQELQAFSIIVTSSIKEDHWIEFSLLMDFMMYQHQHITTILKIT